MQGSNARDPQWLTVIKSGGVILLGWMMFHIARFALLPYMLAADIGAYVVSGFLVGLLLTVVLRRRPVLSWLVTGGLFVCVLSLLCFSSSRERAITYHADLSTGKLVRTGGPRDVRQPIWIAVVASESGAVLAVVLSLAMSKLRNQKTV